MHEVSSDPTVRAVDPDDDAHDQSWFSLSPAQFFVELALPQNLNSFVPPSDSQPLVSEAIDGGHDPPKLTQSSPRSPPLA